MTGFSARILGTFAGLQYNSAAGPNKCFGAVESGLTASSNLFYILTKVYMPWYVPEAQLIVQDTIALTGGFYTDCEANKFFDSMTALFSEEGASALGARFVTAQQFELKKYNKIKADPKTTSFQRGEAFGKAFGAINASVRHPMMEEEVIEESNSIQIIAKLLREQLPELGEALFDDRYLTVVRFFGLSMSNHAKEKNAF